MKKDTHSQTIRRLARDLGLQDDAALSYLRAK